MGRAEAVPRFPPFREDNISPTAPSGPSFTQTFYFSFYSWKPAYPSKPARPADAGVIPIVGHSDSCWNRAVNFGICASK